MKFKTKLLFLAALFVLALPLILTGTASAKYISDGAVPDGTGGWVTPNDMECIKGLKMDGTLDVAAGITSRRDCIYYNTGLTSMDPVDVTGSSICGTTAAGPFNLSCATVANCKYTSAAAAATWDAVNLKCYDNQACVQIGGVGNDGYRHSVSTSTCLDSLGSGKSLTGLDRTAQMCAGQGGIWKQTSSSAPYGVSGTWPTPNYGGSCVAYGSQFAGQDATGTPLAWGTEGTVQAAGTGFCYTNTMITDVAASCPSTSTNASTAFGYSVMGANCTYAYGITGNRTSALTKADGTSYGPAVNMASFTTMGDCLANGGSWANWIPASTTALAPNGATIATFDLTRQAVDGDEGCLHCHSTKTEYNGPAERFKDSYLKTGHKNMLRKVTPGQPWSGPDGADYATVGYAAGSINWGTLGVPGSATATVSTVAKPLLYIFGDWMAPAPGGLDVVVNMSGAAKYNGGSDYSCAACHTAGWSNTDPTKGLCSLSSKTTSALCTTAGGSWYPYSGVQAIGTPGYAAKQPGDTFPGITFGAAGQWDLDGIMCGRCHNATVPTVTTTHIAASIFPSTLPTGGGMGNVPGGPTGTWATKVCYSCHQSMAKTLNGTGLDADLAHPENIPVKNNKVAPLYEPEFSGHVLGGSFLNSVHGKATGTVAPNSLGKYDIATATYTSAFKGYMCWQSSSSTSPAKTKADGTEIKDKTTCENLYGAGAWRPDAQGNCTTCHDVHNSLFVAGQEGLRKECESCHEDATYGAAVPAGTQVDSATFAHPKTTGTPFDTDLYVNACEVCHMPKATSGGFPMHLWRIKADAAYSTFPTACEFGIGTGCSTATLKNGRAAADGAYAPAVWVDLDYACGQCHGGGSAYGQNPTKNGAPYILKNSLADYANEMHNGNWPVMQLMTTAKFTYTNDSTVSYKVNFVADTTTTTCPNSSTGCTYSWDFTNDGIPDATGASVSNTYGNGTAVIAKLTVKNNDSNATASTTKAVTPTAVNTPLVAGFTPSVNGDIVTLTDATTGGAASKITVKWGDGASNTYTVPLPTMSHTYATTGTFKIVYTVKSVAGLYNTSIQNVLVTGNKYNITVSVTTNPTGSSETFVLRYNGSTKDKGTGVDTKDFGNRKPSNKWTVKVRKDGYSFDCGAGTNVWAPADNSTGPATVNCTATQL
jgi:hypothetical protein